MRSFEKKDMKAGVLAILICAMFICIGFSGCTQQQQQGNPEIKNPTTYVRYDIGEPRTLDPAEAYDSASTDMVFNIYDHISHISRERYKNHLSVTCNKLDRWERSTNMDIPFTTRGEILERRCI